MDQLEHHKNLCGRKTVACSLCSEVSPMLVLSLVSVRKKAVLTGSVSVGAGDTLGNVS